MGRKAALVIGGLACAVGFVLVGCASSLSLLWLSLLPASLLAHNFTIAKAIVADLAPPDERAGVLGKLGLAAGIGFMVGPAVNPFVHTRMQACVLATSVNLLSLIAIILLPSRDGSTVAHAPSGSHNLGSRLKSVRVCAPMWVGGGLRLPLYALRAHHATRTIPART
jgi:MFS family permease